MEMITMMDLEHKLGKLAEGEMILDVRGRDEFAEGHVPGARNIPHTDVLNHVTELKKFKRIYIHCRSGGRAGMAVQALQNAGVTNLVCIASGGMPDWMAAGLPVER